MKNKYKIINACVITSLTAVSIAVINKLTFISSVRNNFLYKTKFLTYEWRFGNIAYTKQGHGKPILLIHDLLPGTSSYEWNKIIKKLCQSYTVYTIDLLGFGCSDKPAITYTNYLYVQLLSDFIKSIIGKRTNIITSGSSASVAIMACSNDSALFDKLLFINPEPLSKANQIPTKHTKIRKLLIECPLIGTLIYNILVSHPSLKKESKTNYFANQRVPKAFIKAFHEASHLNGASSRFIYSSIQGNYTNFSISHKLNEIDNSISVIGGELEAHIHQTITDYQALNPIIEAELIANTKHFPHIENPEKTIEYCKIFIS